MMNGERGMELASRWRFGWGGGIDGFDVLSVNEEFTALEADAEVAARLAAKDGAFFADFDEIGWAQHGHVVVAFEVGGTGVEADAIADVERGHRG